jgi:hypothetical protein
VILGLLLALASALATNVAFLLKQRGAVLARPSRLGTQLAAQQVYFAPSGSPSDGWSRSSRGCCTSAHSRWRRCRSCRRSSPEGWCSSPSSPSVTSAFASGDGNGSPSPSRRGARGDRADRRRRRSTAALVAGGADAIESAVFAIGAALLAISAHRSVLHRAEGRCSAWPPERCSACPTSRSST